MDQDQVTYEFSTLRFAEFWFCYEKKYRNALLSEAHEERLRGLRRALNYFGVARNLARKHDEGRGLKRYEPLLPIVADATNMATDNDLDMKRAVEDVSQRIGHLYGGTPISLASKVLWLLHRDPFVIFDEQARRSLRAPHGYTAFVERWKAEYCRRRPAIDAACAEFRGMSRYLRCGTVVSETDLSQAAGKEWFRRRVFDIYLWTSGAPR
ncbi:MAG: hypothetical protein ACOC5M_02595 [Chloroflexota bacterium]